jgi:formylglycine-generating enzyme required for sulfatase activity
MTSRRDALDAAMAAVDAADDSMSFSQLVEIASKSKSFDKSRHLRFADWSDVEFAGSELAGFDFSGSHLIRARFEGASILGARFDKAIVDLARPYAELDPGRTNLRAAEDWKAYAKSWRRAEKVPDDEHLAVGAVFQDAPFAPEMVVVPSGGFNIGSMELKNEQPMREVTIAHRLAVGRFQVTFEEWDACVADGGSKHRPKTDWGRGRQPVIDVSRHDIENDYLPWLNRKLGLEGKGAYRLPTEAEWEYCCRAGTTTCYAFGDTITKEQAQYSEEAFGSAKRTVEVGSFASNAWGLHDMHGNVWEWCEDAWVDNYSDLPEDGGAQGRDGDATVSRVVRGGSWHLYPQFLRSALRSRDPPGSRYFDLGFRLARTLNP